MLGRFTAFAAHFVLPCFELGGIGLAFGMLAPEHMLVGFLANGSAAATFFGCVNGGRAHVNRISSLFVGKQNGILRSGRRGNLCAARHQ